MSTFRMSDGREAQMIYINERDPDTGMPLRQGVAFRIVRTPPATVNRLSRSVSEQQGTVAAAGSLIPIIYGRVRIGGKIGPVGTLSGDLVIGCIWGLGEVEAIEEIHINDAAVPGGVTLTNYTGQTTQGVDPTLESAITDYADTLVLSAGGETRGTAYTVARIQPSALDGWPRPAAIIQGRKVFDPRDGGQDPDDSATWLYSTNPALCAADLITSRAFGMGRRVLGLSAAADWCDDEIQAGEARCSVGLALTRPQPVWDYAQLLIRHAQCFHAWEGDAIRLIPDAPVATPVRTFTGADIEGGSLSIRARDISRAPNLVEVRYTEPHDDPTPWRETSASDQLDGVADGSRLAQPLGLSMPGIHRSGEAFRVAQQELRRLRVPADYAWTTYLDGLLTQPGDLVRLDISARQIDQEVRVTAVERTAINRFRISAESYSADLYSDSPGDPDEPPAEPLQIPDGLIVVWDSTDPAPSGWTAWADADGRWLRGAAPGTDPGATGGGGTIAMSGLVNSGGAHDHSPTSGHFSGTGSGSFTTFESADSSNQSHSHSYNAGSAEPQARHWTRPLIRKNGTSADPLPQHVAMLAAAAISSISVELASPSGQLLLRAGAHDSRSSNQTSKSSGLGATSTSGSHNHGGSFIGRGDTVGPARTIHGSAGSHSHSLTTFTISSNPARTRLALYKGATGSYNYVIGLIGLWAGTLAGIPAGWQLCDGSNGTPDLRSRFIELSPSESAGATLGNDTATWIGGTSTAGAHSHGTGAASSDSSISMGHTTTKGDHGHNVSGSASWRPEWYGIAFITHVGDA